MRAALPPGKPVTIFSNDAGPVEGVLPVNLVKFRGAAFIHLLRPRDGKTFLLRAENITLIREG